MTHRMKPVMKSIDVGTLQHRLDNGGTTLLDVREHDELAIAALPGAHHVPLHHLPQRMAELNPAAPIAVLCHHGVRSRMAAQLLVQAGFEDVSNVEGGIDAWSVHIDPAVKRY
jgi:rhodanese-related sulfurtransferase